MSTDSFVNEMLAQGARLQEAREAESKALAALTGMLRDSIAEEHGSRARIQLEGMIAESVQAAVDGTVITSYFTLLSMLERAYRTGVSQGRIGEPGLARVLPPGGTPGRIRHTAIELEDVLARFPRSFDEIEETQLQGAMAALRHLAAERDKTDGKPPSGG